MVVSAVDLLYVFRRSLVLSDQVPLIVQFAGNHCGVSYIVCIVPRRGLQQCYNNILVFILV